MKAKKIKDHFQSEDHVDKAKFVLTRNLFSFLAILLGTLGTLNLIQGDINMFPLLGGAVLCLIVLALLAKFKNYKVAAIAAIILSFSMNVYNMTVTSNFGHFVDFFWIVCMAIYIFFLLGKYWGIFNLFLNITAVVVILYLVRTGQFVQVQKEFTDFSQINFIINIIVSGIVFSYIMVKVLDALTNTEKGYVTANQDLQKSNAEKTIMLKEIHHRVKNNLQVITSLLRLQLNEVTDEKSRHQFSDSINRVSAMAIIHEKMYQSESLSQIDLESYLQSLIADLINSYSVNCEIQTTISSNIQNIEPKSIVPLALIFNELVSNSLEHGFKNSEKGILKIKVDQTESGITKMTYQDSGTWLSPQKNYSFGLELIETFTEQLDGNFKREIKPDGTHYSFEFSQLL